MSFYLIFSSLLIFILLILSSFFSAAETAVIASSKARLYNLVKEGNRRAKIVVRLRRNMGRLVSSLLVGGTLVNITAATLTTGVLVRLFGDAGVAYATFLIGVLIVFYGEVMPKIYAINNPEKTAIRFSGLLRIVTAALAPLTHFIEWVARLTLQFFGAKVQTDERITASVEELKGLIELHEGPGKEMTHQRDMLRSILDLATVDVDEIMTHRKNVLTIDIQKGSEAIIAEMLQCPYTRVPLWRDDPDNIVGVLHAKALFRALQSVKGDAAKVNLYEVATKPWFIPETTSLLDQLQEFRKRREHFALVVDEYGALMGVVTLEDILEEIVGEIVDEHDIELPGVRVSQNGAIVVMGTVTIRDLNRQFDWNLPDEEAATIAGLVLHETRQIPKVGQKFVIHGFQVEILRRQRQQITLLRMTSQAGKEDTELI
ncbi:MAG: HlyC/CorC family transporter [Pseudomonadota bacterium]